MLFAAALTAFACSKDQTDPTIDNPDAPERMTLRFRAESVDEKPEDNASAPDTRTTFAGGEGEDRYNIRWKDDTDEIGVYIASAQPSDNAQALPIRENGVIYFMAEEVNAYTADDAIYAYYPYSAENAAATAAGIRLAIPAAQEQTASGVFDGRYNPMVAVPTRNADQAAGVIVKFRQMAAMAEFDIYSSDAAHEGETVRTISFASTGKEAIAGSFAYDLTQVSEGTLAAIDAAAMEDASSTVTVTVREGEAMVSTETGLATLYMALVPGTYTGDVTITTDKAVYTFAGKTIDFQRAYVKRFKLNLANATVGERITGSYEWTLATGDLGTTETPATAVTAGSPEMKWSFNPTASAYLAFNNTKGYQIGSGSKQVSATLTTSQYGDEIKSIVVNASVANSGNALLTVLLDGKAIAEPVSVTQTDPSDYTFAPQTPVQAGTIQIKLESQVQKAMYLKSVKIVSANQQAETLAAPAVTVDTEKKTFGWTADPDASGYEYTTDGGQTTVSVADGTSVDYASWEEGTYEVQVRALGDGDLFVTSAWSEAVSITVKKEIVDPSAPRYIKVTENLTDWSGEYIIAAENSDKVYALTGQRTGKNLGEYAEITAQIQSDGSILSNTTIAGYVCTIEGSTNGYTILSKDGYVGYQGSSNELYFNATATAKQYEWTISVNNGAATIKNANTTSRIIQFNTAGGQERFAAYTSPTGVLLSLYKLEDKTPRIEVAEADKTQQFAATTTEGTIAFAAKNLTADVTAAVSGADWFTATVDNPAGTVAWTATENTGSTSRTATLTLSSAGADDVVIAIEQLGQAQQIVMTEIAVDAEKTTATGLTVTFAAVEGAAGFRWSATPTAGGETVTGSSDDGQATSLSITGLQPLTEYTVEVTAVANGTTHKGEASKTATATTKEGSPTQWVEKVIYSTGFESSEGFTTGTNYQGTVTSGSQGKQWKTYYGTPSTSSKITGSNSMAMRLYSDGKLGYTQTEFDLPKVTKVTYKAKVGNTNLKLDTYYSKDDGNTWTSVDSAKALTTSAADYEFTIDATGKFESVRIKFAVSSSSTKPSSKNYQLTIDDINIYGMVEE